MLSNLQFWTLVAGFLAFVLKFLWPGLPLDSTLILSVILLLLAAFGIYPKLRARATVGELIRSLEFWTLLAGLAGFVVYFYVPDFPFDQAVILGAILFVLKLFGIEPSILAHVAVCAVRAAEQAYKGDDLIDKKFYALKAARAMLKGCGYLGVPDEALLDAIIEKAVYDQFNDPVVHKFLE